jgi:hypothetical protein
MRYRRRWQSGLAAVFALLAGVFVLASPAQANFGPHTLTYNPPGRIHDGEVVAVTGTGFDAKAKPIVVTECAFKTGGSADCDLGTLRVTKSDASGNFTIADYVMHKNLTTFNGRHVNCAVDTCSLSAQNLKAVPLFSDGIIIQLPFGPPLTLTAALHDKGTVTPLTGIPTQAGVATVTGTITCSRPAFVNLQANLAQIFHRFIFTSFAYLPVDCNGTTPFKLVFHPQNGLFAPGQAEVTLYAYGSAGGINAQTEIDNFLVTLHLDPH